MGTSEEGPAVRAVRLAANPHEAMRALAAGIDRIEARLARMDDRNNTVWSMGGESGFGSPEDVWRSWGRENPHLSPELVEKLQRREDDTSLAADDLTDLSEVERDQVLSARKRLAEEDGSEMDYSLPEGDAVQSLVTEDETIIDLPVVTPHRAEQRRVLAEAMNLDEQWPGAVATDERWPNGTKVSSLLEAYVKGGPMWLYLSGKDAHDFILGLPYAWRREMVEDVMETSPRDADELSREILKARSDEEAASTQQVTDDNITNMAGRHG